MTGPERLAPNSLVRVRQQQWRVIHSVAYQACTVVAVAGADGANRRQKASFVLPFEQCDRLPAAAAPLRVTRRGWRRLVRRVLVETAPSPETLRAAVHARFNPMPYQLEPALSYLRGDAARMLIADAVGLGKTVQAGLIVAEMLARHHDGRALIVVPGGLRDQWRDELWVRFEIAAEVLDASGLWKAASRLPVGVNPWMAHPVAITSIDFVKRPEILRSLESLAWDVVVFDEAHALAGHSDRYLAATGLAVRGRAVVLLTATPHNGDPEAFRRLCNLGDIAGRFPLVTFRRTRAQLGTDRPRRSLWLRLRSTSGDARLHESLVGYARRIWTEMATPGARLAAIVLLKRGASSTTALARSLARRRSLLGTVAPAHMEHQRLLPLGDDDEAPSSELGWPGLADREQELRTLEHLLSLTGSTGGVSRKTSTIHRLLRATREPVIVFTQYRDTLEELATALTPLQPACIHGGMPARERAAAARAFTQGAARVLLATDAASEGLNLHARCRLVVSFDLPWTPVRVEQRTGRVDRIGQSRRVHTWQLVARGTYEEVVASRVLARADAAVAALDALDGDEERATAAAVLVGSAPTRGAVVQQVEAPHRMGATAALAAEEARRIALARVLSEHASPFVPTRPFVASFGRPPRRALLGYQVVFADPEAHNTWETVCALLHADVDSACNETRLGELLCDERARRFLKQALARRRGDISGWRRAAATALRRNRAIEMILRAERARLSAVLLQPHLFSTRAERAVTPQLQLLDESVARLREASLRTRAVGAVSVDFLSPLFGALLP